MVKSLVVSSVSTNVFFYVGDKEFYQNVVASIKRGYEIGSEDINDVLFVGQGVCWKTLKTKSLSFRLTRKEQ